MDKPNKAKSVHNMFKSQSKNSESYIVADNLSDDEDKQKHNVVNNAQLFFKSIKDKFKRCKSSMYKSKQRISSMDYKNPQNSTAENASSESNVLAQHESENLSSPPPVPIRILSNETDRNYTGRNLHLPAAYVDISEILQTNNSEPSSPNEYLNNLMLESGINGQTLKSHIDNLAKYGWYWGPMSKKEAEEKLCSQPDGSFLVRDSASQTYLFTISFRCFGLILHSRIKYLYGKYSVTDEEKYGSVIELIADGMSKSKNAIFSFSTWNGSGGPSVPVRLIQPVSRFTHVQSLQHLCRFVIRKYIAISNIQELPLPEILKSYLQQAHY